MNTQYAPKPIPFILSLILCSMIGLSVVAQDNSRFIPETAIVAIVAYPNTITSRESMEMFPHEIVTAFGEQHFGVDPMQIGQVIALIGSPSGDSEPQWGAIVRFDEVTIPGGEFFDHMQAEEFNGMKIFQGGPDPSVVMVDSKTFLIGQEEFLMEMVEANSTESQLARMLKAEHSRESVHAFVTIEPVRNQIKSALADSGEEIPEQFKRLLKMPDLIDTFQLTQEFDGDLSSRLTIVATKGNAEELDSVLKDGLRMGKELILSEMTNSMDMDDAVQKATINYAYRLGDHIEKQLEPTIDGDQLVYETGQGLAAAPIAMALILPAVQQVRGAARRVDSANRMRQLIIAMHNFHDANKRLPTNIYDEDGNALLSWRVQILPYFEEGNLYDQFRLDEPWDSEHNIQLVEQMPESLQSPDILLEPGKTIYLAPSGENTVFDGAGRKTLEAIFDGTSRTIALVEGNESSAVTWTQPSDLVVNWDNPLDGIGGFRPEGFNAALFDGSTHVISHNIDWEALGNLFNPNDGNVDNDFDY